MHFCRFFWTKMRKMVACANELPADIRQDLVDDMVDPTISRRDLEQRIQEIRPRKVEMGIETELSRIHSRLLKILERSGTQGVEDELDENWQNICRLLEK